MCHKNQYLWQDCYGISPNSTRKLLHYWVGGGGGGSTWLVYIAWVTVYTPVRGFCERRIVHKVYRIEDETKWISFCRHFSINFLVWKLFNFNWNFTEFRTLSSSWELISFGSSLGSNRQQPGDKPLLDAMMIQFTDAYMRRRSQCCWHTSITIKLARFGDVCNVMQDRELGHHWFRWCYRLFCWCQVIF